MHKGPVANPDLELRGGPGLDLLAMAAIFPSVISSFLTQSRGGGARSPPLDPPLGSVDALPTINQLLMECRSSAKQDFD